MTLADITRYGLSIATIALLTACGGSDTVEADDQPAMGPEASGPRFGETTAERDTRLAEERRAGLGDMWVSAEVATEHSAPDGRVVNRVYHGQKFTIYEKRGDWYRTTEDGFDERWTNRKSLSASQPPEKPTYDGPEAYRDTRIAANAIPGPGQYGLSRSDVDILWKGAKLVLQSRPDCASITNADKSVKQPDTYYVTCRVGGMPANVFFTKAEAEAADVP